MKAIRVGGVRTDASGRGSEGVDRRCASTVGKAFHHASPPRQGIFGERAQLLLLYLSAMAVSNLHGGGLTVQRVLGDDLARFAGFVHASEFREGQVRDGWGFRRGVAVEPSPGGGEKIATV